MPADRAPRRTAAELRNLIIDAGLAVLYRRGLRATASHVPMTEALEELEATEGTTVGMGSIFGKGRLWSSVRDYQVDLFKAALSDRASEGPNDASRQLGEDVPDLSGQPFEVRREALIEICRVVAAANDELVRFEDRRTWSIWVAIWATAVSDSEAGDALLPFLRESRLNTVRAWEQMYERVLHLLGMRLREPYTVEQFATLAESLRDGVVLRSAILPERTGDARRPGDDRPWGLLGIGMVALVDEFIEDAEVADVS